MTKELQSNLSFDMLIAAKCEALDNVHVVPITSESKHTVTVTFKTLNFPGWKKRLAKKSVDYLSTVLNKWVEISDEKPVFNPYKLGTLKRNGIWRTNTMKFEGEVKAVRL